jgi:aspartate aminotransferase/aminotransferase
MTGWRLGYAVARSNVVDSMVKFLQSTSSSVSSIAQWAGVEALMGPQQCVAAMVGAYRRRRDVASALLADADMLVLRPEGAFYVMANIERTGLRSRQFAFELLADTKVSVSPGSAFGQVADSAVRLSLASSDEDLLEGIQRLTDFAVRRLPKPRSA